MQCLKVVIDRICSGYPKKDWEKVDFVLIFPAPLTKTFHFRDIAIFFPKKFDSSKICFFFCVNFCKEETKNQKLFSQIQNIFWKIFRLGPSICLLDSLELFVSAIFFRWTEAMTFLGIRVMCKIFVRMFSFFGGTDNTLCFCEMYEVSTRQWRLLRLNARLEQASLWHFEMKIRCVPELNWKYAVFCRYSVVNASNYANFPAKRL